MNAEPGAAKLLPVQIKMVSSVPQMNGMDGMTDASLCGDRDGLLGHLQAKHKLDTCSGVMGECDKMCICMDALVWTPV